jgi:hypothetical protein
MRIAGWNAPFSEGYQEIPRDRPGLRNEFGLWARPRFFRHERTVDENGDESGLRVGVSSSSTVRVAVLVHRFPPVLSNESGLVGKAQFFQSV